MWQVLELKKKNQNKTNCGCTKMVLFAMFWPNERDCEWHSCTKGMAVK